MKKIEFKNENLLYVGTAEEIERMWAELADAHMEDWTFVLNPPKFNSSQRYGLYVDFVDGLGDPFDKPQMGVLNASGVLEALELV